MYLISFSIFVCINRDCATTLLSLYRRWHVVPYTDNYYNYTLHSYLNMTLIFSILILSAITLWYLPQIVPYPRMVNNYLGKAGCDVDPHSYLPQIVSYPQMLSNNPLKAGCYLIANEYEWSTWDNSHFLLYIYIYCKSYFSRMLTNLR